MNDEYAIPKVKKGKWGTQSVKYFRTVSMDVTHSPGTTIFEAVSNIVIPRLFNRTTRLV